MMIGHQHQINAPQIVEDRLQAPDTFEFIFLVVAPLLAFLQDGHNFVNSIFTELLDPTDGITGEGYAETLEALKDFIGTVVTFFQVELVIVGLFKS